MPNESGFYFVRLRIHHRTVEKKKMSADEDRYVGPFGDEEGAVVWFEFLKKKLKSTIHSEGNPERPYHNHTLPAVGQIEGALCLASPNRVLENLLPPNETSHEVIINYLLQKVGMKHQ